MLQTVKLPEVCWVSILLGVCGLALAAMNFRSLKERPGLSSIWHLSFAVAEATMDLGLSLALISPFSCMAIMLVGSGTMAAFCLTVLGLFGSCPSPFASSRSVDRTSSSRKVINVRAKSSLWSKVLFAAMLGQYLQTTGAQPIYKDLIPFTSGAGARFIGSTNSYTGRDVAQIGDHNGDGFVDFIIGVALLNKAVIVMKKNTTYSEVDVVTLVSGQYFRVINGPASSQMGSAVGGIGDINGDSFDDVIIGAGQGTVPSRTGLSGYAYVIFGTLGPFTDLTVTDSWTASSLGFRILGPVAGSGLVALPRTARGLGDVNNDGIDDFAISARLYKGTSSKTSAGVVWVIFGKTGSAFDTIDLLPANFGTNGIYFTGAAASDSFGYTVMPAGDFNNDGIADFLVGAASYDPPTVNSVTRVDAGAAYLLYGSTTALVTMDMSTFVTGSKGVRFLGAAAGDNFGSALSGVGDVNGDGIDDIAIGAPTSDPLTRSNAGTVYVIYGSSVVFAADVDLITFNDFSIGFAIYGRVTIDQLSTVAPAGDINRDGVADILVGSPSASTRNHLIFGQTDARTTHVDTKTDDVISFYFLDSAYLGYALDGGQDLNGDGIPDILLAGYLADVTVESGGTSINNAGAVWLLPGPFIYPPKPSASPTIMRTAVPTRTPTFGPSRAPTIAPSNVPTVHPTVLQSAAPTFEETPVPSVGPSPTSTVPPSAIPTEQASAPPSAGPSEEPSAQPSAAPTADPSAVPSMNPTQTPSATPSASPSVHPSVNPSPSPSLVPTLTPSAAPTASPTELPSAQPSVAATFAPSLVPTARPTVDPYMVELGIEQDVYFIDKEDYEAEKVPCNNTIQHTVSDLLDGVTPERVTDIVVEEEEVEGGRVRYMRATVAAVNPVSLKYKVTVYDPVLSAEVLTAQLKAKVASKEMDTVFRHYALLFNATRVLNCTFGEPKITHLNPGSKDNEKADSVSIALIVGVSVGGAVFLLLLVAICVCVSMKRRKNYAAVAVAN